MSQTERIDRSSFLRGTSGLGVLSVLLLVSVCDARGQIASTLSQVTKVYVEPFGQEREVVKLRDRIIEQLRRKGKLEIVPGRDQADAVIKGSGSIWVTGYVSISPRAPSATRLPVLQGFLSVEVIGKDNDPLWSYLVTPGKSRVGDITKDLTDELVEKFFEARKKSEEPLSAQVTGTAGEITLIAAGATFPAPLYQRWFESFHERHPNITIKYSPVGSEAGIQRLMSGQVDFAASDVPLSEERMAESKRKFSHFASVIGAVVPAYNLKGIADLNFAPNVLAGIYLGKIRKWNDPAIQESNRGVKLPDSDIAVIHRSDGSGTTSVWTDYLSKLSPEWKTSVGSGLVVRWPVGIGEEGNEALATEIQQTPNSIGYVELAYALQHQLGFGAVRNRTGRFIKADLNSVTAAALGSANTIGSDSRVSITDAPGKDAYPVATFTWWLVPQDINGDKRTALEELLEWMLSSGQKECSALAYAPLPREVLNRELQLLDPPK